METLEYNVMRRLERNYWWFLGKRFLVETFVKGLVRKGSGSPLFLDIGCGTGMVMELLGSFGRAFGLEISPKAIHFLKKHKLKRLTQADANGAIPFKDNQFFTITCMDVLEHIEKDVFVLREAFRVCKPGGYMLVTVPAFDILWSPHDVALHHKRRYTKKQILGKMKGLQWELIKCSYYNSILFFPILIVRIIKNQSQTITGARSDFFLQLPGWLNRTLSLLLRSEIRFLKYFDFPFGVSLLLVLKKPRELLDQKGHDGR